MASNDHVTSLVSTALNSITKDKISQANRLRILATSLTNLNAEELNQFVFGSAESMFDEKFLGAMKDSVPDSISFCLQLLLMKHIFIKMCMYKK